MPASATGFRASIMTGSGSWPASFLAKPDRGVRTNVISPRKVLEVGLPNPSKLTGRSWQHASHRPELIRQMARLLITHPLIGKDPDIRERTDEGLAKLRRLKKDLEEARVTNLEIHPSLGPAIELLIETLYWEEKAGVKRFTMMVETPSGREPLKLSIAAKGDLAQATRGIVLCNGFGVDSRGFAPSLTAFQPGSGEAMVSIAHVGAGTVFPGEYDPTPAFLTDVHSAAVRCLLPGVMNGGELVAVGNSMGAMIAMGVVLDLAGAEPRPRTIDYISDNGISWDVLKYLKTPLYKLLKFTKKVSGRIAAPVLTIGLKVLFSIPCPWVRRLFVEGLYTDSSLPKGSPAWWPSPADYLYYEHFFRNLPKIGSHDTIRLLARIGASIDRWWEFLSERFPRQAGTDDDGGREVLLPGKVLVARSSGDSLLYKGAAETMETGLLASSGNPPAVTALFGPHVEKHARALQLIEELRRRG